MIPAEQIAADVTRALTEDVGSGDVSADLIPADRQVRAHIIAREACVLAGSAWAESAFRMLTADIALDWHAADGERLAPDQTLVTLSGPARSILTAERTALNFLQTLSGTATTTRRYVDAIAGTGARILDTRKTLPGLRLAQKYAVTCGGGQNHRVGLFDMLLLKENHIMASGSITEAVHEARQKHPDLPLEVEVETLAQLEEALGQGVIRILLDNFSLDEMRSAVAINRDRFDAQAKLEASGNVELDTIRAIAETGVDFISSGALTKHVRAIDLSLRFLDD